MTGDGFFISASPGTQVVRGSRSSCARPFRTTRCPHLSDLRSRSELQRGSCQHDEELRDPTQADQLPQSLAERCCRTLGWELQAGFTRSCHRAQRRASETADDRVRSLLPRGPHAPCAGEENACGSGGSGEYRCDLQSPSHAETRWPPPSLQPGRLSVRLTQI